VERRTWCVACVVLLGWGITGATKLAVSGHAAAPGVAEAHGKQAPDPRPPEIFDAEALARRLATKGMAIGNPIMVRIFKLESELEVWMSTGRGFELLAVYPICSWSGTLGPKLAEGDKQSPEGLYAIGARQLHRTGRWRRSLNVGFPNTLDRALGRTGSYVLVHGGCTSTGCYAMTNPVMEEIFRLSEAALAQGQKRIQVHAFPFRMTPENLAAHAHSEWSGFWSNLKEAYDIFERTRVPPSVSICNNRYVVGENDDDDDCDANVSTVSSMGVRRSLRGRRHVGIAPVARRFAHVRRADRRAGRNVRQAYAAARVARMAAAARQRHAGHAGQRRHR
jgi:murein L,D-transpeptidase YafK